MAGLLTIFGVIAIVAGLLWLIYLGAASGFALLVALPVSLTLIGAGLFLFAFAAVLSRLDRIAYEVRSLRLAVAPQPPPDSPPTGRREPRL